jgi:hypothetical protein
MPPLPHHHPPLLCNHYTQSPIIISFIAGVDDTILSVVDDEYRNHAAFTM